MTKKVQMEDYKSAYIQLLRYTIDSKNINCNNEKIWKSIRKMNDIVNKFEKQIESSKVTAEEVNVYFSTSYTLIKQEFIKIRDIFYKEKNISPKLIETNISTNGTLEEFYEKLKKIDEKYGKSAQIMRSLEEEILIYRELSVYNQFAKTIKNHKNIIYNDIVNKNKKYPDSVKKLHTDINKTIVLYLKAEEQIFRMKSKLPNSQIELLEKELLQIEENIKNGVDIFTLRFDLVNLINQINISINDTKNNKTKISALKIKKQYKIKKLKLIRKKQNKWY